MPAAMEGRAGRRVSLRTAIVWGVLGVLFAAGLSFYKARLLERFVQESADSARARQGAVLNLFQASFYFFYEDQFLPGIRRELRQVPHLMRIQVLSSAAGSLIFDSSRPPANPSQQALTPYGRPEVIAKLSALVPSAFLEGDEAIVVVPAGQYAVVYTYDGRWIRNRVLAALVCGLLLAVGASWLVGRTSALGAIASAWRRFWRLRAKFLVTIVLVNVMTGAIVFVTLSEMQTQEQTERIRKESVLFAQFSTAQVISDFSNFFYFYYADKFLPGIKTIIATNENLVGIRIISRRTLAVLFDSELAAAGPPSAQSAGALKATFDEEVESELRTRDVVTRRAERGGEQLFSVINTYRNENQEALFYVEYLFSFASLDRSIVAIRRQILLDLVPALALGLLIAAIFAQLLLSPIRRLVAALQRVSVGDYDVAIDMVRSDEVGDLIGAFNSMAAELRKKQELRKFLSDSTYRQVMEVADTPGAINRIGGTRVSATVLFTDIRNFVSHCEALDAEEVTAMLNEYFSEMVEVVYRHGGEVDKFIGDALLAVFYAADEVKTIRPMEASIGPSATTTALQAIYCALEMRERLRDFNQRRIARQKATIEIGVGITHGEIISGPIGSKDRMDFTVIGDVVNLANRIEKLSKKGSHTKVVFSQHVEEKIRGLLEYVELEPEPIKGKEELIRVYELVRIRDLETLTENLKHGDPALRKRSVELLGQSRNPRAIPQVLAVLNDKDMEMRLQAVLALTKLANQDNAVAVDALLARMQVEPSEKVIAAGVTALGKLCFDDRILGIARFLDHPSERVVANTVEALGQGRNPKCIDLILPKLSSRNNRVKANAAMALFAAGHLEVIDTLKPMLMHSDPLMRSSAAFAIGELTILAKKDEIVETWRTKPHGVRTFLAEIQESVPMLVSLLKDPEPMVKRQAVIALGKIKDRSSVLPIIDNIDPRTDSKELIAEVAAALRSIGSHKLVREVIGRLT